MHINDILAMGGYAMYVWPAYCITLLVFGINVWTTLREKKRIKKLINHYES